MPAGQSSERKSLNHVAVDAPKYRIGAEVFTTDNCF